MPDACLGASLAAGRWTQGAVHTCTRVRVCVRRNQSEESKENVTERKHFEEFGGISCSQKNELVAQIVR